MSLGKVTEIMRMPWGKANDDEWGFIDRKQEQPGVRSSQNTSDFIRIPALITTRNSDGIPQTYNVWTIRVNQRGARFECPPTNAQRFGKQRQFKVHELVWIEVPATGKAAGGQVVWADIEPNLKGNFEFAVKLDESRDLFQVSMPAQGIEMPGTSAQTESADSCATLPSAEDLKAEVAAQAISDLGVLQSVNVESQEEVAPGEHFIVLPPRTVSFSPETCETEMKEEMNDLDENLSSSQYSSTSSGFQEVPASSKLNSARGGISPDRLAEVIRDVIESAVQKEGVAASERLVNEIKDQVVQTQEAVLENLRREVVQQVSLLEEQLLQRSRARTEQMLSVTLETAIRALSGQITEMAGRTEERVQAIFNGFAEQLEQRSSKALVETTARLQEEMEKSSQGAHATIIQKVLAELNEKQKDMMEQVQRQIGMATEQNLTRLRGGLTRTLQELTEASQNGSLAV